MDIPIGHDQPCPWCGHSHHFTPCDTTDCGCPPRPAYPGDF